MGSPFKKDLIDRIQMRATSLGELRELYSPGERMAYMMPKVLFVLISAVAANASSAQATGLADPTFDVASVKLSSSERRGWMGGPGSRDPSRYSFYGATLEDLIAVAYGVEFFQILSKASLDAKRYDVDAKLPLTQRRKGSA